MDKKYFLFKLYPPRPSFHLDQDENEKNVMQQHSEYWRALTMKIFMRNYPSAGGCIFQSKKTIKNIHMNNKIRIDVYI